MGRPLKIVVVGDSQNAGLRVAADLEQCGYDSSFAIVSTESNLTRTVSEGCDLVLACRSTSSLPVPLVLQIVRESGIPCPVLVYADKYTEEDIVALMRAGAGDCLRKGDLERLRASVERELSAGTIRPDPTLTAAEAGDRYRALIEEIPALTYVAWPDETGSRAYVSPQLQAMTGFTPAEWLAEPDMWVRRLHPHDRERVLREFREACSATGRFASEYRILDLEGRVLWWKDEGRALPGPDGGTQFVRGFVLDITEQKRAEQSLHRLRYYDQITGLPNRVLLLRRLGQGLAEAARSGQPLALLILALHRFQDIANILGYHNGDLIVQELAGRLGEVLGAADKVARLRGDEFGVLLPDADANLAVQVAERTLSALQPPFMIQKLPIEVSASVGIAIAPEHGSEAEQLLRRANMALQAARKLGGGALKVFSEEHEPHDPKQLALLGELRQALEANQLVLHYQPKVDLKTSTVIGAEALLRWPHPKRGGFVPPNEFIPLAEQAGSGLMRPLTRWVLDRAVAEAKSFERDGRALPVAVNVSASNLHDERLVQEVAEALDKHSTPAERLQLEVTESAVMADRERAIEVLGGLADRGVNISIDDFGTGYTSLGLLRELKVAELKIDGSFVRGMVGNGAEDTAIVRSTSDLAHNLELSVVAEGVEDQWTLDTLLTFGCDQAQGYYIARPMRSAELVDWLGKTSWKMAES
jgi:diguanylate cyclase (GGDEF)-like protein/PAS domain S-box-containing protein